MDTREQALLSRLWELQHAAGLNDAALARDLGVDASLITHMKAGRRGRQLGLQFAMAAAARFPELRLILFPELPTISSPLPESSEDGCAAS